MMNYNGKTAGILTARQRNLVDETKKTLKEGLKTLRESAGTGDVVAAWENVLRELSGFDSELFIVSTMGMLKAGKSSLVNLLARSRSASPTGYGSDTTLRPALVMQATLEKPEGEIEVWFANDPAGADDENGAAESRRKLLASVFDYLRGVEEEPKKARKASHALTSEKLEAVLCKPYGGQGNELPSEPLIVVVRVQRVEVSLLSDKVVVLDTPGLDSMNSEWTNSGWYHWLMAESDLLLFLQSSVAPLNQSAGTVIRKIKEENRRIPIWLIQNRMEAKHWMSEQTQQEENENQRGKALKNFENLGLKNPPQYTVNLGKATTALFESEKIDPGKNLEKKDLEKDSGFGVLEGAVKKNLQETAARQRRDNCANKVLVEYGNAEKLLENFRKEKVDEARERLEEKGKKIERAFETLENLFEPTKTPEGYRWMRIRDEDVRFDDGLFKFRGDEYDRTIDAAFEQGSFKVKKLNDFKAQRIEEAKRHVRNVRLDLTPEKISWSDGENGAKQRLSAKISKAFNVFCDGIKFGNAAAWEALNADNGVERGVVGERIALDGEAGECFFRDYDSAGNYLFWEKKRSAKEAKDALRGNKVEGKTLEDALKAYFEDEEKKARRGVAEWANKTLENLARDFLKKLEKRRDDELQKIRVDSDAAERLSTRLRQALDVLSSTRKKFFAEMGGKR